MRTTTMLEWLAEHEAEIGALQRRFTQLCQEAEMINRDARQITESIKDTIEQSHHILAESRRLLAATNPERAMIAHLHNPTR